MNLNELHNTILKELESFVVAGLLPALRGASDGAIKDVLDRNNTYYYQYLSCLMRVLKPEQVVELGGAMGVSAICMCEYLPETSKLYSITLQENGLEFSYITTKYPQLVKVIGNDKDLENWPRDLDFKNTDILFIDGEHTKEEVQRELNMYLPLIGRDKLVLLDDIKFSQGMWEAWLEIDKPKLD